MASTLTKNLLHITFSTKLRAPFISPSVAPDLYGYIGGICRNFDSPLLASGGIEDHVHLLIDLSKNVALAPLMLNLKRESSKWCKSHTSLRRFGWQKGYFSFSIGESGFKNLTAYIANQRSHHNSFDFKTEVRGLLTKYKMTWDERYIWD